MFVGVKMGHFLVGITHIESIAAPIPRIKHVKSKRVKVGFAPHRRRQPLIAQGVQGRGWRSVDWCLAVTTQPAWPGLPPSGVANPGRSPAAGSGDPAGA
jgi:hypothetical protein